MLPVKTRVEHNLGTDAGKGEWLLHSVVKEE
jgi:hypothetical protein